MSAMSDLLTRAQEAPRETVPAHALEEGDVLAVPGTDFGYEIVTRVGPEGSVSRGSGRVSLELGGWLQQSVPASWTFERVCLS